MSRLLFVRHGESVAQAEGIVGEYAVHTDGVYEVRNLRQLEGFVEKLT